MKPREVTIRIGTLVIEGAPAGGARGLSASLARELERLLAERGVPRELLARGGAERAPDGSVTLAPGTNSGNLGERAAQAVYRSWQSPGGRGAAGGSGGGQS